MMVESKVMLDSGNDTGWKYEKLKGTRNNK